MALHFNIDVPAGDLCQWLAARKRVSSTWAQDHAALRPQLLAAVQNSASLRQHIHDAEMLNFFEAERLFSFALDLAEKSGQGSRSIFGGYSNPEFKSLDALLTRFRTNKMHLVDMARFLAQLVQYDM